PAAVPQEPLPAPAAQRAARADALGQDRDAGQPHDRGGTLGLSRHARLPEFDRGHDGRSRREHDDQTALARPAYVYARGTAAVRDPARSLGSTRHGCDAAEEVTPNDYRLELFEDLFRL